MSLAQRVERPYEPMDEAPPPVATLLAIPVDFRDITKRPARASLASVGAADVAPVLTGGSELAFELLNEVTRVVPVLVNRYEMLEAELADMKQKAKAEDEAGQEVAREWQQIAGALKLQVEGLEKGLRAMKQRAEAAELQVTRSREEAEQSQHAAAEAECLASLFRDKVISSFGAGSPLHPLLDPFRSKAAAQD